MIDACAVVAGPPSLARDVLASTDCFIATRVEQAYGQLLMPGGGFSTALTIGLTLYVAVYGYRLVLGQASLSLGDLVPHFVKIGLVLAMVTSWPTYERVVFDLMFSGPQEIAGAVMERSGNGSPGNVVSSLQSLFDEMTDFAGDAWAQRGPVVNPSLLAAPVAVPTGAPIAPPLKASPFTPDPATAAAMTKGLPANVPTNLPPVATAATPLSLGAPQFVAMALWGSALLMLATSVGLLLIVRIILAVVLMFGPVFIVLALFGTTRSVFEGWLRVTVKFALVPLIVLPLAAVLVAVMSPFVAELEPGPILAFRDTPALAILMIVVVFAIVLSQALSLTGTIAGAIRLPRPRSAIATLPLNAAVTALATPIAQPSRADVIASALPIASSLPPTSVSSGSSDLVAGRRVDVPADRTIVLSETEGRLGQAYRRTPPRNGFTADLHNQAR